MQAINEMSSSPIKNYLKLYQANGLCSPQSHPPMNYEILDENTLLRKTNNPNKQNYQMYPFNKIFSSRISNSLMAQNIRFLDDLYQGINHTLITMLNQESYLPFTTGTIEHYGFLVEIYLALYNDQRIHYKSNTIINLSLFGTVHEKPNQFIDLLNGQRYTFLSKKDVDTQSFKTFYEVKISSLQQYLVAMKIGLIRFKQCCNKNDFFVWRVSLLNEDEFSAQKTVATGNIVLCQQSNKNLDVFMKQLAQFIQKSNQPPAQSSTQSNSNNNKVNDHGSLFSCLQTYLRNGKISMIQCLMNDYDQLQTHLQQIKDIPQTFMNKPTQYKINQQPLQLSNFINQIEQTVNKDSNSISKRILGYLSACTAKQVEKYNQIHFSFKTFIKDSIEKLNNIVKLYKSCQQVREQFYQRQKFPVGIEIKDLDDTPFTIKTFYIAKIYSLSEKFQMQNLQPIAEKMMTIKNQIEISLKTLTVLVNKNSKKIINNDSFSLGKSYVFITTPKKKNRERNDSINDGDLSLGKYQKAVRQLKNHLQKVKKFLKYILNLSSRYLHQQKIKDQNKEAKFYSLITSVLDNINFSKILGQDLFQQIQKNMKKVGDNKKQKRQNGSLSKNQDMALCQDNDNNLVQTCVNGESKLGKKSVVFDQRVKKSVTCGGSLQSGQLMLDINTIETSRIQRTKRLVKQHESLQKSLMQIKSSQIKKHLKIIEGISQFQKKKEKLIQQNEGKQQTKEKQQKKDMIKKVSKTLLHRNNVVEKQNGSFSNYEKSQIKKKKQHHHIKSQIINPNSYNQQTESYETFKPYHLREDYHSISLHVNAKKDHSIMKINNINSEIVGLPEISKSVDKFVDLNSLNKISHKNAKNSSPKLKKRHLFKVVKNSVHEQQLSLKNSKSYDKINQSIENKSFLPEISLQCRKIIC